MEGGAKLQKPQLKGLFMAQTRLHLTIAIGVSIFAGILKYMHNRHKKKVVADFYANYDIEKEFNIMVKKGVFDSVKSV